MNTSPVLPIHILAGALALAGGYVALAAAKGGALHRRSGKLFVGAMITMSLTGAAIAILNAEPISIVAGLLTFYFVTTAFLTVRNRSEWSGRIDRIAMLVAVSVALFGFIVGFRLAGTGRPEAYPMFMFGIVGLLAARGDLRMIRAGGIQGPERLRRHLWRMCFAMWVAAASFFWGPPGRVPDIIYIPALLPIPVLAPIAVMTYWLVRLRRKSRTAVPGLRRAEAEAVAPTQGR
jgi:uncharacterized membrane protein